MSEPNLQPLAALLASHPEECAAVVAALAITDPCDGRSTSGIVEDVALYFPALPRLDVGEVGVICDACCAAGFAELDRWGDYAVVEGADRYAIARMGAAAWLRARCGGEAVAP